MPRTGWVKPDTDHRLSDHVSWGLLARVFRPEVVDRALADAGRVQQRSRLLPARVVVYYVMGLALFPLASYEEVMRMLAAAQGWAAGDPEVPPVPTKAALSRARARLGPEVLEALFRAVARPLDASGPSFYGADRLMSVDSALLDVPDTPANVEAFGRRPPGPDGAAPLPQVRLVGLSETGSRAILDAVVGRVDEAPRDLAADVLARIPPDALVLAGRSLFSPATWAAARATGAHLLWRVPAEADLPIERHHADGSYDAWIPPDAPDRRHRGAARVAVRIIDFGLASGGTDPGPDYRLATSLHDPSSAPAPELAALYARRTRISSAFDELRAHHLGTTGVVLRSKVPDGVRQEVYAYLCVHYAIRWLMHTTEGAGPFQPPVEIHDPFL